MKAARAIDSVSEKASVPAYKSLQGSLASTFSGMSVGETRRNSAAMGMENKAHEIYLQNENQNCDLNQHQRSPYPDDSSIDSSSTIDSDR